jgi:hypothetical protein
MPLTQDDPAVAAGDETRATAEAAPKHAAALDQERGLLPLSTESTRSDERRAAKVAARIAHGP